MARPEMASQATDHTTKPSTSAQRPTRHREHTSLPYLVPEHLITALPGTRASMAALPGTVASITALPGTRSVHHCPTRHQSIHRCLRWERPSLPTLGASIATLDSTGVSITDQSVHHCPTMAFSAAVLRGSRGEEAGTGVQLVKCFPHEHEGLDEL